MATSALLLSSPTKLAYGALLCLHHQLDVLLLPLHLLEYSNCAQLVF